MRTEKITFTGSGGHRLSGRLELPADGRPHACALFAHCFTCSKNLKAAVNVTRALSARGIAVLRFDFTGLGESEGDFSDTNFSSNVEDIIAAAHYMERHLQAPGLLVGHSLGGAAVLQAAARLDSVRAVATIGAPAEPAHVLRHLEGAREEIEEKGAATVSIGGRPFRVERHFLEDLQGDAMEGLVRGLRKALLIFHAPTDEIVGIDNAARIYGAASHPKSFISLDRADHLLTDPNDSAYVGAVLAAWSARYLGTDQVDTSDEMASQGVVVSRTLTQELRTDIRVGQHALISDEPVRLGGTDEGPTPYELVAAGLGACTSMTLQMYAGRKDWPLEEARVRLRHQRVHLKDCEDCDDGESRLDRIDREIELIGPLDSEQRARLMQIANRCPVHRTLEPAIRIVTSEGWRA